MEISRGPHLLEAVLFLLLEVSIKGVRVQEPRRKRSQTLDLLIPSPLLLLALRCRRRVSPVLAAWRTLVRLRETRQVAIRPPYACSAPRRQARTRRYRYRLLALKNSRTHHQPTTYLILHTKKIKRKRIKNKL